MARMGAPDESWCSGQKTLPKGVIASAQGVCHLALSRRQRAQMATSREVPHAPPKAQTAQALHRPPQIRKRPGGTAQDYPQNITMREPMSLGETLSTFGPPPKDFAYPAPVPEYVRRVRSDGQPGPKAKCTALRRALQRQHPLVDLPLRPHRPAKAQKRDTNPVAEQKTSLVARAGNLEAMPMPPPSWKRWKVGVLRDLGLVDPPAVMLTPTTSVAPSSPTSREGSLGNA